MKKSKGNDDNVTLVLQMVVALAGYLISWWSARPGKGGQK